LCAASFHPAWNPNGDGFGIGGTVDEAQREKDHALRFHLNHAGMVRRHTQAKY
jgi:hypothetical protein